jgi:hypothetical protein
MISLGTATLVDGEQRHQVHAALTWQSDHTWQGILGAQQLDWASLSQNPLTLEVPADLGPSTEPMVTDMTIETVLDNEVRASGVRMERPARRRLGVFNIR